MDSSLLNNVTFKKMSILEDELPPKIKLIIFRNKMVYYNSQLQTNILKRLYEALLPGAHIAFGIKESLECCSPAIKFSTVHKEENIYKKSI